MADVMLPPWLHIARLSTAYLDNTASAPGLYTRTPETTGFGGDRLRFSLEFTPTDSRQSVVERAALRTFLARLRGRQNRAIVWDPQYMGPRGAFKNFTGELLPNNTFANGTTSFAGSGTGTTIAVTDRVMRVLCGQGATEYGVLRAGLSVTQYRPYVFRAMFNSGGRAGSPARRLFVSDGTAVTDVSVATDTSGSLGTVVHVAQNTTLAVAAYNLASNGSIAGDFFDTPYMSVSQCALVDNGLNAAQHSDEIDNAYWTKNQLTPSANSNTAPDGSTTAEKMTPTAVSAEHYAARSAFAKAASAADVCVYGCFKADGYNFVQIALAGGTGSASANFDVSNGTKGTVGASGDWSNARSEITSLGNGWYLCELIGRGAAAVTSYSTTYYIGTTGPTFTFTGNGTSGVQYLRLGNGLSSSFLRPIQTTGAAAPGTSQSGSSLYVKGLPASTAGLLLPDDRFGIITSRGLEMKIVTAPLDSDAAELGYLQFEPPLMGVPADNAPIIVHNPMTRAIFAGEMVGWEDSPGVVCTASAEFEEAA